MFRACVVLLVLLSAGCDRPGGGGAEASRPEPVASAAPSGSSAEAEVPGAGETATTPASTPSSAPAPVEPDPQVTLGPVHRLTVRDLDGNPVSLARFAGRPMIIEIWATWCGPCLANRRTVHSLRASMPERMQVIGLSVDMDSARGKGSDLVKAHLKSNPANDFEGMASAEFMEFVRRINPSNSIPKTMYVDSKGRVADLSEGTQSAKWLSAMARNLR
jgi:thiol-disulfide isomerase/thioredoxin